MPFTVSHTAAAIPFRRPGLVTSALVVGTMAPDFEYFLALKAHDRFGHTFPGILVLTLPLALVVLWMFHSFVKVPASRLLPQRLQNELAPYLGEFRFWGVGRFALIVLSVLVGIGTHVAWDSLTHAQTYPYNHWSLLRQSVEVPVLGTVPFCKVLQHGSTILGLAAISGWLYRWYMESERTTANIRNIPSRAYRMRVITIGIALAVLGGFVRALWGIGIPADQIAFRRFIGQVIVTCMALAWWQLVGYGVLSSKQSR